MGGLASLPGTVMCLLDNGTEDATKRFTARFAFSDAVRRVPAPWARPLSDHP
ncbi:hypothetical protein [Streptomyces pratensis]|uniref:hypothetical protein n=1 Tax=Streptomyces pratensis TaxID=1169025 RepID=UPI00301B018F